MHTTALNREQSDVSLSRYFSPLLLGNANVLTQTQSDSSASYERAALIWSEARSARSSCQRLLDGLLPSCGASYARPTGGHRAPLHCEHLSRSGRVIYLPVCCIMKVWAFSVIKNGGVKVGGGRTKLHNEDDDFWVLAPCRLVDRCQRFGEKYISIFRAEVKMETVCFSKTLASTDESTRRQNPKEHHHPHRRENLKSYIVSSFTICSYSSRNVPGFSNQGV
jgi:hypothetical protein